MRPSSIHDLVLEHYSANGLADAVSREQCPIGDRFAHFKPKGLWLSVRGADDWPRWCKSEAFGLKNLAVVQRITLSPVARVLWLRNAKEIDRFTKRYGKPTSTRLYSELAIGWTTVAENHQGLIVAPYNWSRRLDTQWYYGWDCASGCIWDVSAIARVSLPQTVPSADAATS